MELSLHEAAAKLGKSERQIRYLIQTQRISARKVKGRWLIDTDSADAASPQKKAAQTRRLEGMRQTVEETLGLPDKPAKSGYSVRDLRAFQTARSLHNEVKALVGEGVPASAELRETLYALTRGCHQFRREAKHHEYSEARRAACNAVTTLLLIDQPKADALADRIESELLRAIGGLLQHCERHRDDSVW